MTWESLGGLMGLAVRAGQATLGADLTLRQIKAGKAQAVLIDEKASENTQKKLIDACCFRKLPYYILPAGWIDRYSGKNDRMAVALDQGKLGVKIILSINELVSAGGR